MATQTWTLDVAGLKYIDSDKIEHTINTNETIKFTMTDFGDGGMFVSLEGGGCIDCSDGYSIIPESDKRFTFSSVSDFGTVGITKDDGEICFVEPNNVRHPFKVSRLKITNADGTGANNIVSIILESTLHQGTMEWTNVNTA